MKLSAPLPNHGHLSLEEGVHLLVKQMIAGDEKPDSTDPGLPLFWQLLQSIHILTYSYVFPGKCKKVSYEPQSVSQKIALK